MNYQEHIVPGLRTMELSDLRVFRAVVQTGGITRAAARLHRVPSNVTTRIRKLEEDLGTALFLREGRGLKVSPAGKTLLDYAERMLALADEARDALNDSEPRGTLRLGSIESAAATRLPRPLSQFIERHPAVSVELHTAWPAELIAQVLAGELDAALVLEPINDARLDVRPIFEEELVIVAAARHPLIATPRDVQKRALLAFHTGCAFRQRLEEWFGESGIPVERLVEVTSYHAILGCAVAGMGIALLPRAVVDSYAERARLSIHPLTGRFRSMRSALISRKDTAPAKIRALIEVLTAKPEAGRLRPAKDRAAGPRPSARSARARYRR
jgi:DNA-binding transcriptional LysR family regulator